jgi:hypothetical protein
MMKTCALLLLAATATQGTLYSTKIPQYGYHPNSEVGAEMEIFRVGMEEANGEGKASIHMEGTRFSSTEAGLRGKMGKDDEADFTAPANAKLLPGRSVAKVGKKKPGMNATNFFAAKGGGETMHMKQVCVQLDIDMALFGVPGLTINIGASVILEEGESCKTAKECPMTVQVRDMRTGHAPCAPRGGEHVRGMRA